MSYGEDCNAGVDAQRDAESVRRHANELESQLTQMRRDHDDEIRELRSEIRDLWDRVGQITAAV